MLDLPNAAETDVREALGPGFPKHPLHKIACIGALVASRQPEGWRVDALGAPHIGERPGKPQGIDGSRVEEMVLTGQIDEVARYCESDVLNTYRVWLVYELFRGSISCRELDWSETQIRDLFTSW